MKKIFAFVMALIFVLGGCDIKNPHSDELPIKDELVEVSAEKAVIKISILAETDYFYDDTYLLERNGENGWETAEMTGDTREIFTREEISIKAGETAVITVDFTEIYGILSPGEYRINKQFWFVDENGEKVYDGIFMDFTIEEKEQNSDPQEDPDIVTVEVKEVSAEGITLGIKNNYRENYVFGEVYYLERKNGKNWEEVPELEGEFFFDMIAYVVLADGETEWSANWEHRYSLEKGEYRIIKDGWFENEEGQKTGTHRMTAEFIIE